MVDLQLENPMSPWGIVASWVGLPVDSSWNQGVLVLPRAHTADSPTTLARLVSLRPTHPAADDLIDSILGANLPVSPTALSRTIPLGADRWSAIRSVAVNRMTTWLQARAGA